MNFGEALEHLKQGKKIRRSIWGGYWMLITETYIRCENDRINPAGFRIKNLIVAALRDDKGYAAACPYQEDILAEDWLIVE